MNAVQGVPSELRMGFVDLNFDCSSICLTLLGLMGIWQKWLVSWARWWNTEIKVNPTQVYEHMVSPEHTPTYLSSNWICVMIGVSK